MNNPHIIKPTAVVGEQEADSIESSASTLQYEYDTLIEEYRTIHAQILARMEADEKGFELVLLTVGVVTGAISIIIQQQTYVLLLVLALPFHVLTWNQLRRTTLIKHHGNYLRKIIIPQINSIIERTSPTRNLSGDRPRILFWEEYNPNAIAGTLVKDFMNKLPTLGKLIIQFGSALILIAVYIYISFYSGVLLASPFDIGLLVMNAGLTILSLFGVFRIVLNKH